MKFPAKFKEDPIEKYNIDVLYRTGINLLKVGDVLKFRKEGFICEGKVISVGRENFTIQYINGTQRKETFTKNDVIARTIVLISKTTFYE